MAISMPNGQVIAPFERVKDVNVIMTIVHPQPIVGLGNMVILNKVTTPATLKPDTPASTTGGSTTGGSTAGAGAGSNTGASGSANGSTGSSSRAFSNTLSNTDRMNGLLMRKVDTDTGALYREYRDLDAVEVDYGEDTPVYKKASAYFAQPNHSDRVAVLDWVDGKLLDTMHNFWLYNWTFAIFADNKFDDDTILLSNICEANEDHFLVLQSNDLADFNKYYGQNYTIGLKHDVVEPMDAAFVGNIANLPVGSVTWKFKELNGITPDDLTVQERAGIENAHCIAYIEVNGRAETAEGFSMSGEYIDILHGALWVKTNVGSRLQRFLQTQDKVPYDQTGINELEAIVNSVLLDAFGRGIIQQNDLTEKGEYTVSATPRSQQSATDLSKRHYGGLSFTYHAASAIHTVTVNGVVQSDTILS